MLAAVEGISDLALTTNGTLLAAKAAAARRGLSRVTVSLGLAGRGRVSRDERHGRALGAGAGGHRRRPRRPGSRRSNSTRSSSAVSTTTAWSTWPASPAPTAWSCGSSSTWTWARPTAGAWTTSSRRRGHPPHRRRAAPGAGRAELSGRGRPPLSLPRRAGEIGVIASVTQPFCRDCTRARLSTDGKLYTCLFAGAGHDLRRLRQGANDHDLRAALTRIWRGRGDRYSELRAAPAPATDRIEMSYIGGWLILSPVQACAPSAHAPASPWPHGRPDRCGAQPPACRLRPSLRSLGPDSWRRIRRRAAQRRRWPPRPGSRAAPRPR